MSRLRLPAIALTLFVSSNAWADLRTFDVDPQYQQEVFTALRRILTPDEGKILPANGRVEQLPSGQILVNADTATLEQVEKVLQGMRARPPAATPRAALRYWAVFGRTGGERTANTPNPPMPPYLAAALEEVRRIHGDLTFRVLGSAALATSSGQLGEADGWPLSVEQTVYVQHDPLDGDTLNASISMQLTGMAPNSVGNSRIGNLTVRTNLRRGEFVVLGESHVVMPGSAGEFEQGPVFYIVHWER
jgi:hypothetical protein